MNDASVMLLRCTNAGSISSEKDTAGGIAVSCRTGSIADCRNAGSVTSPKETGGILAYFQPGVFGTPCEIFTVSGCENSGAVSSTGNYAAGGICGMIYGEETRLVFENCFNSGSIYTVFPGGLTQEIYAGGIVGCCPIELPDENLLPLFDDLRIENCESTGKLDGDREPDILCTDDLCGSWQSRLS